MCGQPARCMCVTNTYAICQHAIIRAELTQFYGINLVMII